MAVVFVFLRGGLRAGVAATFDQSARRFAVAILCGWLSLIAYGIVIWVMHHGPMGPVSALRETSILFAALIGRYALKEKLGAGRITSCLVIAFGAACLGGPAGRAYTSHVKCSAQALAQALGRHRSRSSVAACGTMVARTPLIRAGLSEALAREAGEPAADAQATGGRESLPTRKRTGEPRRLRRGRSQTTRTTIRFPDQHDGSRMLRRDFIAGWGTRRVDASGARHDFSEIA
jgi:hypothetical protein